MPGYTARRNSTRAKSRVDRKQQSSVGVDGSSKSGQKTQDDCRRNSQGSALASAGAKRKRSEAKFSDRGDGQQAIDSASQVTEVAGTQNTTGSGSGQQKAKSPVKSPARSPAKLSRKRKARCESKDSVCDPEDEVSDHGQPEKPASPPRQETDSRQHALKLPATSEQKNAGAATCAAASLGSPLASQVASSPSALRNSGRDAGHQSSPLARGLTGLVSAISNPSRQSGSHLPPRHPGTQYGIYRNMSQQAVIRQRAQLLLAEAPFHDAAKSGVASFAYFEPGFMTRPFSVSAFATEAEAAMSSLEGFLHEANKAQEQVNPIEAASLRIASLEEQQQSAIQAKAGEAERAEAAKRQTKPKQYSPLCSPPAPPSAAPQKAAQATQQPSGLMSLVSSLMPPPSPRFRSSAAQSLATSSQAPAENDPSAASVLPVAELPAARPTEGSSPARLTSQLQSGGTSRAEPMQLNVPVSAWPVGSAPASALAASPASASTAAATALSIPAGLPAATAAVAAASDALIARFKADGIGAHTSSPATATAAPAPAATATTAAADTTRAPAPRMSALSQIASALSAREGNAESLRRHSPQTRSGVASVGSLSSSGQPTQSHTSAADVARPPPYNGQPEMQAAPPAAAADAFLSSAVANGRAALAAMPLIESPNSDSERGGGSGWRFRARTPAKSQTKQQLELLDQMAREVKERWQQGLADAAKDLMSVRVTQDIRTLASLKRWNRNVAADSSSRLSHAEAFAQRAQVAFNPDRRGSQAEGSAQGQPLSLSPLNNDTVLTFSVHRFDRPGKVLASVSVLGRQQLTVLRDTIRCEADATLTKNERGRPSACFYFEGVFYNDMRDRSAIDMSHNIRQFCQEHGIGVPPDAPADPPAFPSTFHKDTHHDRHSKSQPRAAKMEDTTFNDLFLRVGQGAGYVYMHQGCCEHLVELSDVRSVHHAELLQTQPTHYPLVLKEALRNRRDCALCKLANIDRRADWVTYNDRNAPSNPAFWCEDCYKQMHYDESGNACYQDCSAFEYMYEHGMLKQKHRPAETPEGTDERDEPDDMDQMDDFDEADDL